MLCCCITESSRPTTKRQQRSSEVIDAIRTNTKIEWIAQPTTITVVCGIWNCWVVSQVKATSTHQLGPDSATAVMSCHVRRVLVAFVTSSAARRLTQPGWLLLLLQSGDSVISWRDFSTLRPAAPWERRRVTSPTDVTGNIFISRRCDRSVVRQTSSPRPVSHTQTVDNQRPGRQDVTTNRNMFHTACVRPPATLAALVSSFVTGHTETRQRLICLVHRTVFKHGTCQRCVNGRRDFYVLLLQSRGRWLEIRLWVGKNVEFLRFSTNPHHFAH